MLVVKSTKSETRNPKQAQNPNYQNNRIRAFGDDYFSELRASDLFRI